MKVVGFEFADCRPMSAGGQVIARFSVQTDAMVIPGCSLVHFSERNKMRWLPPSLLHRGAGTIHVSDRDQYNEVLATAVRAYESLGGKLPEGVVCHSIRTEGAAPATLPSGVTAMLARQVG